jgi:hypothetical protein
MTHEGAVFLGVVAAVLIVQTLLLLVVFLHLRRLTRRWIRLADDLQQRVVPLLDRLNRLLEDSQANVRRITNDAAELVHLLRLNGQKFDRLLTEATDRLRLQVIHLDRLVTGALASLEDAVTELRKAILEPVRTAAALVRGVKTGLEFLRGRNRMPERRREAEDEGLFV